MKRLLYIIILLAATAVSCDKMPDDSLLDGFWQVSEVKGVAAQGSMYADTYWGFRLRLLQLSNTRVSYYAHTTHRGDSLFIYDLCHNSLNATEEDNNEWITRAQAYMLNPWGIYPVDANSNGTKLCDAFHIEKLKDGGLMLTNDSTSIKLKKY